MQYYRHLTDSYDDNNYHVLMLIVLTPKSQFKLFCTIGLICVECIDSTPIV